MADIFVSYANEDRDRAKVVAVALEHSGWSVWWDREVAIGRTWDETIEEEIEKARSVVVLWSPRSVTSDWVKNEARDAKSRGILIPALIEPAKLPLEFRHIQTADLTGWGPDKPSPEFEKLLAGLRRLLGPSPAADRVERVTSLPAPTELPTRPGKQPAAQVSSAEQAAPGRGRQSPPRPLKAETAKAVADYSERVGVFTGAASNKTHSITGKASLDIFKINKAGRTVSARFGFSEGLYSKGTLVGTIDEEYHLELVGIISSLQSGGSFDCQLRCRFVGLDRIEGEYFLQPRAFNIFSDKQDGELALVRE
jgi:hypothetical protein